MLRYIRQIVSSRELGRTTIAAALLLASLIAIAGLVIGLTFFGGSSDKADAHVDPAGCDPGVGSGSAFIQGSPNSLIVTVGTKITYTVGAGYPAPPVGVGCTAFNVNVFLQTPDGVWQPVVCVIPTLTSGSPTTTCANTVDYTVTGTEGALLEAHVHAKADKHDRDADCIDPTLTDPTKIDPCWDAGQTSVIPFVPLTPTPTITPTNTPTETPTNTPTPTNTNTPTPTDTPTPTNTATDTPTNTPTPTNTNTPTPTNTNTPTPTNTNTPTASPTATANGCTPGFWKTHPNVWGPTGFTPGQTVGSVFTVPFSALSNATLIQALAFQGGSTVQAADAILLRAAVAALLNSAHPLVGYPLTTAQVIAQVNAAIATGDRGTILALASQLDGFNNAGCSIDAHGNPI